MFINFSLEKLNYSRGQIAPFLIALIAIVVMLIMITVNIGKISMFKTDTSNAADAGALAGATVYGQGLMNLGFLSDEMFGIYIVAAAILASCRLHCSWAWAFYGTAFAIALAMYVLAIVMANKIPDNARDSAYSYAFQNIGVDEVKPYRKGETYEEWLKKKSKFSQWMDDEKYKNSPHKYEWPDRYGTNYVQVSVSVPTPFPIPLPGVVWVRGKGHVADDWICCKSCPCKPAPFIASLAGVSHEKGPIKVTARRKRSERDFGLWKMRYGTIESYAEAETYGGSVLPLREHTYDSKLVSTR